MKKVLRIAFVIFLLFLGLFLFLRYFYFAPVSVAVIKQQIPQSSQYLLLAATESLCSKALQEGLEFSSKGADEEDDEEETRWSLEEILTKGLWNGLAVPEEIIIHGRWEGEPYHELLLPLKDSAAFTMLMNKSEWTQLDTQVWTDSLLRIEIRHACLAVRLGSRPELANKQPFPSSAANNSEALIQGFIRYADSSLELALNSAPGRLGLLVESHVPFSFSPLDSATKAPLQLGLQFDEESVKRSSHSEASPSVSYLFSALGLDPSAFDDLWNGQFSMSIYGLSTRQEESISYVYNDDFEKIEQRDTTPHLQSDISISIGLLGQTDSLFFHRNWVEEQEGQLHFRAFPWQDLHFHEQEQSILLYAPQLNMKALTKLRPTNRILDFRSREFSTQLSAWQDSLWQNSGALLESMSVQMSKPNQIQAEIIFQNQSQEGLFELLEILEHF